MYIDTHIHRIVNLHKPYQPLGNNLDGFAATAKAQVSWTDSWRCRMVAMPLAVGATRR